ncbi:AAA family ATPase [Marmoricola sp. URHB0036]|uniref:ATP-binding protein n=1 Tax=Marmoricola sp. URHB0036 TaxID=1298863 RepID=UPI0004145DBB|nr:AAA family ATPase [Marmoricola sp. URHB0036]
MLRLRVLGRMEAELDGDAVAMPTSERARALVGWLALNPGLHDRSVAASQLWPDAAPDRARANLRTAVWSVHRAWGAAAPWLESTRSRIGLADGAWIDADEDADEDAELLPGFEDDWVREAREQHREAVVRRLVERAESAEREGEVATAVRISHQVCRQAPYDEGAHRALLRRLLLAGDRATAVVASREFSERLRTDLGVRPSPPTRAVQAEARAGRWGAVQPRLFGRADEVTTLASTWRSAARGTGQVVLISGEAGIGKSSLVGELLRRVEATGGRSSVAVGVDVAGQTPFGAWLELCHGLVETAAPVAATATWPLELNRLSGELGATLGHPGSPSTVTAPELERLRVFESVLRLVEWSCADRPIMLVLDDAHRADRASLRLTGHIGRRIARLPLLLVLTQRHGVPSPELDAMLADLSRRGVPVTHLRLAPIDDRAVAAIATSLHHLDQAAVEKVVASSEGNPLLAVESARAVAAGEAGPPANLRLAVRASTGRLSQVATDLVHALAVAARPLTPAELERLDIAGIDTAEDAATAEGLLARRSGRLGFRHDLLREAVYTEVRNVARWHDRLVSVVDPDQHADVARHLEAAGREREAAQALAAAAKDARAMGALEAAVEFLTRATALDADDGQLWLDLEEVCAWVGRPAETEAAWERALALLPEHELASAWSRRGRQFRSVLCRPEAARRAYGTAESLLPDDASPSLRVECLLGLAWSDAVAGEGRLYEELLRSAEGLLDGTPDAITGSDIVETRMQGLIRQGRFADAVEVALAAAPQAVSARLPDRAYAILTHAACVRTLLGDLEGALELADRAVTATQSVPSILQGSLATRAHVLARLGRYDEAAETVEQMQHLAERLESTELAATAAHDAGLVALAAGRYADAAGLLAQALEHRAPVSRPGAALRLAEALALSGDADAAAAALRQAVLEPVGRADQPWSLVPRVAFVQALIGLVRGDLAEVERRLEESVEAWHRVLGSKTSTQASTADGYLANLVDLGRPPVVGLVEPARELARIDEVRRTLPAPTVPPR